MRRTSENYIKVLKAMKSNLIAVADIYAKDGNKEQYEKEMKEVLGLSTAIALLEDKSYFDDMVRIFDAE